MATAAEMFDLAVQQHQRGEFALAEPVYLQIMEADQHHADARHLLGVLYQQTGRTELAVPLIRQAIALNPRAAGYHFNLGNILRVEGQKGEAEACYRQAMSLNPLFVDAPLQLAGLLREQGLLAEAAACYQQALAEIPGHAGLHNNLGITHKDLGQLEEAKASFERALQINPHYADALDNLANALRAQGKLEEAADCCRRALLINPALAHVHNTLGVIRQDQGRTEAAMACYREALRLNPHYASALNNLATILLQQGHPAEAAEALRQALRLQPHYALAHVNLGNALKDQNQLAGAVQSYREALRLNPRMSEAHYNLGNALVIETHYAEAIASFQQALRYNPGHADAYYNLANAYAHENMLDEAIANYRQAFRLRPGHAETHVNLGNALKDQGLLDEALGCYRAAQKLEPGQAAWQSNELYTLLFHPRYNGQAIFEANQRWGSLMSPVARPAVAKHPHSGRLRIGYVSPDFRDHVVGRNMLPLFRHHDHEQFEITVYSLSAKTDALTLQFRQQADRWRCIAGWPDDKVDAAIRDDGIDILVDLTLHMAGNRLPVLARKPAPLQVTFAGYPGSTGLAAIDYRLTDPFLDPPGMFDDCYSERSYRLPRSFWCYEPATEQPLVGPLPALSRGVITFGCLNNFCKTNDEVLTLWASVLRGVPGSSLLLLAKKGSHRERTRAFLANHGVTPERVEFCDPQAQPAYLALYNRVDVGLDTVPYNGHSTSLDSFWMGAPVVTLVGKTVVGRAGLSQLTNLGLAELAATEPEDFVRLAIELAENQQRLQGLRAGLRDRMKQSPLMDAVEFARGIETAYRKMWLELDSIPRQPK